MNCPKCSRQLNEIEYEDAMIRTCEGCGGEFIGPTELVHIVKTRRQRFPEAMHKDLVHHRPDFGGSVDESRRSLDCPDCGGDMAVINYCGDSGVFVDRCSRCGGLWLDRDELEHVQILMEQWADAAPQQIQAIAGELEAARQKAAEGCDNAFSGSRFSFINALVNRFLDAA